MLFSRLSFALRPALTGVLTLAALASGAAVNDSDSLPPRGGQGSLHVATVPPRAVAYLGGVKLGYTPLDTVFESGRHTLTLIFNGEEIVRERVNVWPQRATVIERTLPIPRGRLLITAPAACECEVYVDGEEKGFLSTGRLLLDSLESGTRIVRVNDGKKFREYSVVVPAQSEIGLETGASQ